VMRRCIHILAAVAAVLVLNTLATPAGADSLTTADYTLTAQGGLPAADPNATSPQVVLTINPPGGIVPPTPTADNPNGNPLTILPGSSGFDQQGLVNLLSKDNKQFGLSFFGSGLAADGNLHFALSVDSALASTPPTFTANIPGVQVVLDSTASTPPTTTPTPPTTTPTDTPTPTSEVPEPVSLVLWSALAGLGLWQMRRRRRRPAA
jgi:hypothetical protein